MRKLLADAQLLAGPVSQAVVTVPAYFNDPMRAATRRGRAVYVSNYGDGTVTALDLGSGVPAPPIAVGKRPWAIVLI